MNLETKFNKFIKSSSYKNLAFIKMKKTDSNKEIQCIFNEMQGINKYLRSVIHTL